MIGFLPKYIGVIRIALFVLRLLIVAFASSALAYLKFNCLNVGKRDYDKPCDEMIQTAAADFLQSLYEYRLPARNQGAKPAE